MNPFVRWAAIAAAGLAALALLALTVIYVWSEIILDRTYPPPPVAFHGAAHNAARGAHLTQIAGCTDCHGTDLAGKLFDAVPASAIYAKNLTLLHYSDADLERALRHGLRADNTSVDVMPSEVYRHLDDGEVADIAAYLRGVKPKGAQTPPPKIGLPVRIVLITGTLKTARGAMADARTPLDLGARTALGRHLAMIACAECHGPDLGGIDNAPVIVSPDLSLAAAYERGEFETLMRKGKAAGNRELPLMSPTARTRFAHFTGAELDALYAYLSARGRKLAGS